MKNRYLLSLFFCFQSILAQAASSETLKLMEAHGERTKESELVKSIEIIKEYKIDQTTFDEVIATLGNPTGNSQFGNVQFLTYNYSPEGNFNKQVFITIKIGPSKKILSIKVTKRINNGLEDVYVKEIPKNSDSSKSTAPVLTDKKNNNEAPSAATAAADNFPLKDSAPNNPVLGQYYFNTTDKQAYLWNGNEWLQLDNPKNNP